MKLETRARYAVLWIWTIAAWVLLGAIFKLFWGNPALLPEIVRRVPLALGTVYSLAIGIELAIAFVALVKPRWGWWLQVALLVVFDFVLTTQIAAGDTNCGCFGTRLHVKPWVMMVIDSALLAGLLAARPWSCLGPGLPGAIPVALAAVGLGLPWLFDREVKQGEVVAEGKTAENPWILLDIEKWKGKDVFDTPLAQEPLNKYIDVNALPLEGLWVFWRATCDHCATHLKHLAETEDGSRLITLIQLEEAHDTLANTVVAARPSGGFVSEARLPPSISYVLATPGEMVLELGKIVDAKEKVTPETGIGGMKPADAETFKVVPHPPADR